MMPEPWINIVLVGDVGVGKGSIRQGYLGNDSSLQSVGAYQRTYKKRYFPLSSSPILPNGQLKTHAKLRTMIHRISTSCIMPWKRRVEMTLNFNTVPGVPGWDLLHQSRLTESGVVAICYDCSRPETLYNAIYKWHPMVLYCAHSAPIFLLGCKSHQKAGVDQASGQFVTMEEAKKAARQIGAIDALECTNRPEDSIYTVCHTLAWYGYYSCLEKRNRYKALGKRIRALLRRV
ncbi:hypothetical protein CPB86DRAFT_62620 [Serendipita vermifera]|nr:hypothetical protein CPB86DRAFT_62620 [Serendipita vermifera]